jgi:hypothetical protein
VTVITCAAAEKQSAHTAAAKLARRSQWFMDLPPRVDSTHYSPGVRASTMPGAARALLERHRPAAIVNLRDNSYAIVNLVDDPAGIVPQVDVLSATTPTHTAGLLAPSEFIRI